MFPTISTITSVSWRKVGGGAFVISYRWKALRLLAGLHCLHTISLHVSHANILLRDFLQMESSLEGYWRECTVCTQLVHTYLTQIFYFLISYRWKALMLLAGVRCLHTISLHVSHANILLCDFLQMEGSLEGYWRECTVSHN